MARSHAALAALAVLTLIAVGAASETRLRMKALNNSAAVINMTDDVTFGTLSWTPTERYVFEDDLRVDGTLTTDKIVNDEFEAVVQNVEDMLQCSETMQIYDRAEDSCKAVAATKHNPRVREFIDGASYFFCMIMWDHSVRCWGYAGGYCMLGFGDGTDRYLVTENPMTYEMPAQPRRLPDFERMRMYPVAHTYHNAGVVRADGTVWMVGSGGNGGVGDGGTSNRHYYVQTNYLNNVTAIVGGGHSTEPMYCVMEGDDTVYCWGYNNAGQCGVGHTSTVKSPTRVLALTDAKMVEVSRASTSSTCAVRHDGTVWCWGYNNYGQVGNGGTGNRDSPSQVGSALELYLTKVRYVKAHGGSVTTFFALTYDNEVYAWGYNGHGQCGVGDTSNKKKAFPVEDTSGQVMKNIKDVYPCNGSQYGPICALKCDGTIWCWGYNNHGQLGLGDTSQRNRATRIDRSESMPFSSLNNPPMIEHSYGYHTMCGIAEEDKSVWCWGFNNHGQLGVGHTSQQYSPDRVLNVGRTSKLGSRAYHASNGDTTFYALSEDGYTVWAWGYSGHGQVGSHVSTIGTNRVPQRVRLA